MTAQGDEKEETEKLKLETGNLKQEKFTVALNKT